MRNTIIFFLVFVCACLQSIAQTNPKTKPDSSKTKRPSEEEMLATLEGSATFPGGMGAFYKYISQNVKFPKKAKKAGVRGRVYVEFVVLSDGTIDPGSIRCPGSAELTQYQLPSDDVIEREDCKEEAMRLIRKSPNWIPARQQSEAVKKRMTVPVFFR